MDQIYADPRSRRPAAPSAISMSDRHYDIIIIGSGAGGGTMAHALARDRRAHPRPRARRRRAAARTRTGTPRRSGSDLRYRAAERVARRPTGSDVPSVHALRRRRQHEVLGQRALPAAARGLRRIEHVDGVSPAWPIDYETLAPYYDRAERLYQVHGAASATIRRSRRADRIRYPPVPHAPGMARDRRAAARAGPASVAAAARRLPPGRARRLRPLQHVQLVPVPARREERRRGLRRRAGDRRTPNVTLWTGALARRLLTDPAGPRVDAVEVERGTATSNASRPRLVVVSCGAVNSAALLLRSANDQHPDGLANSSGLVGRRYMAHLATMMQGFVPWRKNHDVFQKTRRDQRLLPARAGHAVSARPDPVAGTHARDHGEGRRRHVALRADRDATHSALGVRGVGVARGGLAGDDRRSAAPGEPRDARAGRPHPAASTAPTTRARTRSWSKRLRAILERARLLVAGVFAHSAGAKNTTHQCGTLVLRHRSAHVGARSVLPHARRRESLRRRRVVLPVVGGGEPRADDRRAGAARGRSHHGATGVSCRRDAG